MESRLRRIDLTGTPTVSGDEEPSSSDEQHEEVEEERSQQSEGSYDASEYNNQLIQRYRQAIEDGNPQLADKIEREIFDRWINLQ